jgi:hypothetical protein
MNIKPKDANMIYDDRTHAALQPRKNLHLKQDQLRLLRQLITDGTPERTALQKLVPDVGTSEASVPRALLSLGTEAVWREQHRPAPDGAGRAALLPVDGSGCC